MKEIKILSQQMNDDRQEHSSYIPPTSREHLFESETYSYHSSEPKIDQQNYGRSISPQHRLLLAFISLIILLLLSLSILGSFTEYTPIESIVIVGKLIGLGMVTIAIIIINIVVNNKR
jgi:hypothetical protein